MLGLGLAPLCGLDLEQRLNPLETAPAFVRHVPTSRSDLAQRVEGRFALTGVATEQLWQCCYGAFLIEADQQILLPKHFLELRQVHLLIERPRCAYELQRREATFVDAVFRQADVDEGANGSILDTADLEASFQFRAHPGYVGFAD